MAATNRSMAISLIALVCGMIMLTYASVPLYRLFCDITGFGGTPRQATEGAARVTDQLITVRFNADTDAALGWDFKALQGPTQLRIGETVLAHFEAVNRSNKPVTGTATYNVTPHGAGPYFNKIQCFCFERQTLKPGEKADFPVSYFIDPAILDDPDTKNIRTITLSYTFFPVQDSPTKP